MRIRRGKQSQKKKRRRFISKKQRNPTVKSRLDENNKIKNKRVKTVEIEDIGHNKMLQIRDKEKEKRK